MANFRFILFHAACMVLAMASVVHICIASSTDPSSSAPETTSAPATTTGSTGVTTEASGTSGTTTEASGTSGATTETSVTSGATTGTQATLPTGGITLNCTDTQMIVDIPKSLLTKGKVRMKGKDVRFGNESDADNETCLGIDVTDDMIDIIRITTNLNACGTTMTETEDDEIYRNRVVNNDGDNKITRFYAIEIPVKCSYNRTQRLGSYEYRLTDYTIDKHLSEEGQYKFEFDIYSDETFETPETDYPIPIRIGLNEELFFAASVLSLDGTVDLSIRSCRATPTSSYDNILHYDFIEKGCTLDYPDTNLTYLTDYRIGVEMNTFRFVNEGEYVYIHCDLLACDSREADSLCNTDCVGNITTTPAPMDPPTTSSSRRRRDVSSALNTKRFTRGPLRVVRAAQNSISRLDSSETMSDSPSQPEVTSALNPWMVAMAAMATVVMAMAAVLVVVLRKVNKIAAVSEKRSLKEESFGLIQDPEF